MVGAAKVVPIYFKELYMKLEQLLNDVKKEKPTSLTSEHLTARVNMVEASVQDFLEVPAAERVMYEWPDNGQETLIVEEPYSRLYVSYLKACIDYANEELQSYGNNQAQFESDWAEWVAYKQRHGTAPVTSPNYVRWW